MDVQQLSGEALTLEAIHQCVLKAIEPCVRAAEERHKKAILILTREVQALRKELTEWKNQHARQEEPSSTTILLEDPLAKEGGKVKPVIITKKNRKAIFKDFLESSATSTLRNPLRKERIMVPKDIFEADILMETETLKPDRVMPIEPFSNVDDFLKFEARLQVNKAYFRQLELDFASIPVRNDKKFVKTCWRQMLEDNVAERFSWRGTDEKKSVQKFRTTVALMNAFKRKENAVEENFVAACKSFFQFAKNRQKQREEYRSFKAKSKRILKTED